MQLFEIQFLARSLAAVALSAIVALGYASFHGVAVNSKYHSAVSAEVNARISERLTPNDVAAIQEKYRYLIDPSMTGQLMAKAATSETILISALVWFFLLAGRHRNAASLIVVAVTLTILQLGFGLISSLTAVTWLLICFFATKTRSGAVPA